MRRLLVFVVFVLWAIPAHAFFLSDAWDTYGTPSYNAAPRYENIGPYQGVICGSGGACSTGFGISGTSNPPWNPGGTGHYLHIEAGTTNVPNAGPGLYMTPGNPFSGIGLSFWFKYEGTITTGTGGPFVLRLNVLPGQSFGTDNVAVSLNADGSWNLDTGGTTANKMTSNTWYWVQYCFQFGTTGSNGSESLYVNGSNWKTNTSVGAAAFLGANNFTFDNEFGIATFDFGPWYFEDLGTAQCPQTTRSIAYFKTYLPTADSTPLQFTPNTGSNFSNVNSNPPGSNYNSDATAGQQDIYTFGVPSTQTGIIGATLSTQVEKDNPGDRVPIPTWKANAGTVTTGSLGESPNAATVTTFNGTYQYMMDGEFNSLFGGGAWSATDLQHGGITLGN